MNTKFKTADILKLISFRTGISEKNVNRIYNKLIELVMEEIIRGGKVELDGLGTFTAKQYGGYDKLIFDRRLGKSILKYIEPKLTCKFEISKKMKDRLNAVFEETYDNLPKGSKEKDKVEAGLYDIKEQLNNLFESNKYDKKNREFYCNDLTPLDISKQEVEEIK